VGTLYLAPRTPTICVPVTGKSDEKVHLLILTSDYVLLKSNKFLIGAEEKYGAIASLVLLVPTVN
jgi:hypothetical protein